MYKPASLRLILEQAIPELAQQPQQLHLWVEKGRIQASANSLSFTQHYELTVFISDCTTPIETLIWHILNWLQIHQPDAVRQAASQQQGFLFATDILSHRSADVEFTLSLSEHIVVNPDTGACQLVPEPNFQHWPLGPLSGHHHE